jgi:hypothetical protein
MKIASSVIYVKDQVQSGIAIIKHTCKFYHILKIFCARVNSNKCFFIDFQHFLSRSLLQSSVSFCFFLFCYVKHVNI